MTEQKTVGGGGDVKNNYMKGDGAHSQGEQLYTSLSKIQPRRWRPKHRPNNNREDEDQNAGQSTEKTEGIIGAEQNTGAGNVYNNDMKVDGAPRQGKQQ